MVLEAEMGARLGIILDPFFLMMPDAWRVPIVILALFATSIASQAVITGAFSLTHQAIQLGFMPRLRVEHTVASVPGALYVRRVLSGRVLMVIIFVLGAPVG